MAIFGHCCLWVILSVSRTSVGEANPVGQQLARKVKWRKHVSVERQACFLFLDSQCRKWAGPFKEAIMSVTTEPGFFKTQSNGWWKLPKSFWNPLLGRTFNEFRKVSSPAILLLNSHNLPLIKTLYLLIEHQIWGQFNKETTSVVFYNYWVRM